MLQDVASSTVLAKKKRQEFEPHIFSLIFHITAGIAHCSTHRIHGTGRFTDIRLISMVNESKHPVHGSYEKAQVII